MNDLAVPDIVVHHDGEIIRCQKLGGAEKRGNLVPGYVLFMQIGEDVETVQLGASWGPDERASLRAS